jgi:hypothetical protein
MNEKPACTRSRFFLVLFCGWTNSSPPPIQCERLFRHRLRDFWRCEKDEKKSYRGMCIKFLLNFKSTNKTIAIKEKRKEKKNHSAEECETQREDEQHCEGKIRMKNTKKIKFICDDDDLEHFSFCSLLRHEENGATFFYVLIFIIIPVPDPDVFADKFSFSYRQKKSCEASNLSVPTSDYDDNVMVVVE